MLNSDMAKSDEELIGILIREIRNSATGAISFCEYMRRCLYEPEHGYYMSDHPKIGKKGDFYTSSHIGTLMGEMLAVYFARYWADIPIHSQLRIVEWGGGSGRLAGHIMDELKAAYPEMYARLTYDIVDKSAYHRGLQAETAISHADKTHLCDPDGWAMHNLPEHAVVLSNELLDAFPIHRLKYEKGRFHECHVGWDEPECRFYEIWQPIDSANSLIESLEELKAICRLTEGQKFEVNPDAVRWIDETAGKLASGMLVTIDYGDLAERLYTPNRMNGTFTCYYRHMAHDDPYVNIGRQDMTSHVNFSACIRAGLTNGMKEWTFEPQQRFLVNAGIMDRLKEHDLSDPFHPIAKRNRAIRQLLLGDMGDTFKVLVQKKDG